MKHVLDLEERTFFCDACWLEIDRDLNAAINLEQLYCTTASSAGSNTWREDGRPASMRADLGEVGTKQQITDVCVGF